MGSIERSLARGLFVATFAGWVLDGTAYGDGPRATPPARDAKPPTESPSTTTPNTCRKAGLGSYDDKGNVCDYKAPATQPRFIRPALRTPIPPYPKAPGDPWAAVVGDQPLRMSNDAAYNWTARSDELACTAAIDHCFALGTWLMEEDAQRDSARQNGMDRAAQALGFGPVGTIVPSNANHGAFADDATAYTAYRTVPAAKKNLVPGALVMTLKLQTSTPLATKQLASGAEVFRSAFGVWVVDRVDWDMGFVFFVGKQDPFWITATRVAVLSWRPGGKVTILGGAKRDQLAVTVNEVTLP